MFQKASITEVFVRAHRTPEHVLRVFFATSLKRISQQSLIMSQRNVWKYFHRGLFFEGIAYEKTRVGRFWATCLGKKFATFLTRNWEYSYILANAELLLWKRKQCLESVSELEISNIFNRGSARIARNLHFQSLGNGEKKDILHFWNGKGNSKEMSHFSEKLMSRISHQEFSRQKWRCVKKFWLFWHTNQNPSNFRLCLFSWKYSHVNTTLTLWPN